MTVSQGAAVFLRCLELTALTDLIPRTFWWCSNISGSVCKMWKRDRHPTLSRLFLWTKGSGFAWSWSRKENARQLSANRIAYSYRKWPHPQWLPLTHGETLGPGQHHRTSISLSRGKSTQEPHLEEEKAWKSSVVGVKLKKFRSKCPVNTTASVRFTENIHTKRWLHF